MPEILTYNTPGSIEKEKTKRSIFKSFFDWFDSKDKFTKIYLITFALIILATPFIVNNYLEIRQKAEQQEQAPNIKGVNAVSDEILLKFKPGADKHIQENIFSEQELTIKEEIQQIDVKVVKVPSQARDHVIEALSHNPAIDFAEKNAIVKPQVIPNDPYYSSAWHLPTIQAPSAWDKAKATNILIGICDTGIKADHPDLVSVLRTDLGWNAVDGSTNWSDVAGHGTQVAGVAAAATNNAIGIAGVAWGAQIIPVRITNTSDGLASISTAAKCITYAADHGARAINLSYLMADSSTIDSAATYAQGKGAVTTVAAGNNGADPGWPNYTGFLAVSAEGGDGLLPLTVTSWSNHGAFVDLAAPGANIETTNWYASLYWKSSGTSISAPVVAGVVGLIFGANPGLSASQAQSVLFSTADDLGASGWDPYYGWGSVNADKAINAALGAPADTTSPATSITSPSSGLTVSGQINISVDATDNVGVTKVDLYIDGVLFATDISSPYSFYWDTTTATNAFHTLSAKVYDAAGNIGTSSVTVTVNNALSPTPSTPPSPVSQDTIAPTVSISSPVNGQTVSGNVTISATAVDNVGIVKMEVYVDNKLKATSTTGSVSANWSTNPKNIATGTHTITVKAYDATGNIGSSSVTVIK